MGEIKKDAFINANGDYVRVCRLCCTVFNIEDAAAYLANDMLSAKLCIDCNDDLWNKVTEMKDRHNYGRYKCGGGHTSDAAAYRCGCYE